LYTQTLKFHVPSGTDIQVAVNGWILRPDYSGHCGDDGCYQVLSQSPANGQTTYVIQTYPQAYKRWASQLELEITDVSLNKASPPLAVPFIVPLSSAGIIPQAITALQGTDLLAYGPIIGLSTAQDASDYYTAINAPATLELWKKKNGFATNDDSQDTAKADYFNGGDLGFGRSMHMKIGSKIVSPGPRGVGRVGGTNVAYYVSNYPTVDDAIRRTNLIATVAMDYSEAPPALRFVGQGGKLVNPPFIKFYVYDKDDQLSPSAVLDSNGAKYVPNLCIICHGQLGYQRTKPSADVGARFLPFDLASFQYGVAGRPSQEDAFKQLNKGVYDYNPTQAEKQLLEAWYGGPNLPNNVQNSDAVPTTWSGQKILYQNVVALSCRTCHVTRIPPLDFASYDSFKQYGLLASTKICSEKKMPNAQVTYEKFWLQRFRVAPPPAVPVHAADILRQSNIPHWPADQACP
jgi:hypothetical protein